MGNHRQLLHDHPTCSASFPTIVWPRAPFWSLCLWPVLPAVATTSCARGVRPATWPCSFQGHKHSPYTPIPQIPKKERRVSAFPPFKISWCKHPCTLEGLCFPSQSHPFPRLDWQVLLQCNTSLCCKVNLYSTCAAVSPGSTHIQGPEGGRRALPFVHHPLASNTLHAKPPACLCLRVGKSASTCYQQVFTCAASGVSCDPSLTLGPSQAAVSNLL